MAFPLSKSANQFAVDLFQCYLRRHGDKYRNLLLCPYLIYHSLAMMLVGAKGQTAEQLMKLLRVTNNGVAETSHGKLSPSDSSINRQPVHSRSPSSVSSFGSEAASSPSSIADPSRRRSPSRSPQRAKSPGQKQQKSVGGYKSKSSGGGGSKTSQQHQQDPDEPRHREFLLLSEQLLHGNHEFVHLASFIYLDKGTKRTERYKSILRDYYETKPKKIDFDNVDLMVKTINEDVSRTTENIYNEILSRQEAQKLEKTFMLLVNAVFFRGFWLSNFTDVKRAPFAKYSTPEKFDTYQVDLMSKLDYLPVVEDEQLEARLIRLPFEASDLQMLLILPNDKKSDSTYLCQRISAQKLQQLVEVDFSKSKHKTVRVSMPVFCIDSGKISIQSTLVEMGAGDLFDKSKANMSGVCDNKQVWLHKILHRCFIICDNRGSITSSNFEKARRRQAKLESGISSGRSGVIDFVADHPFMYLIFDSVTKTILLMGLYTDPSETLELVHENQLSPEEAHQIYTEGVYKT